MSTEIPEGHVIVPAEVLDLLLTTLGKLPAALGKVNAAADQLDRDHRQIEPLLTDLRARREAELSARMAEARSEGYAAGMAEAARLAAERETVTEQIADAAGRGVVEGLRSQSGRMALGAIVIGILGALAALIARAAGVPLEVLLGG